jgi:hypothetical protein
LQKSRAVLLLLVDEHSPEDGMKNSEISRLRGRVAALSLTLLSVLVASTSVAQELTGPPLETEGKPTSPPAPVDGASPRLAGVSVLGGAMAIDMSPMNERLSDAGYPEDLPLFFPIVGGQAFGLFSHFVIGGSGAGIFPRTADMPGAREVSASGAWGTFDFGYQLVRVNGFLLAPVASLGGYGMAVILSSTEEQSFDEVLATPNRSTTLSNKGVLGGISMLAKLVVLGRPSSVPGARSGLSLGLRVGGLYGIPFREWQADGVTADDGPSFGLRGGYAALSLGAGTW